jgi:hypothetical protein
MPSQLVVLLYEDLKLRKRRRRSIALAKELLLSNLQVTYYASVRSMRL